MDSEYSLEIKRTTDGEFIRQVDIFNTYENAQAYADEHPIDDDYYYTIWCIEYDEDGEEIDYYPVY